MRPTNLTLYQIADELVALKQLRDDADYEGDAEAVKVIDGQLQEWIQGCLATKADGIRGWLKHLAVQAAEWQEEADRFTALAKKAREDGDRLKTTVLYAMQLLEMKQVAGSRGDVLLHRRRNGGVKSLVIAQSGYLQRRLVNAMQDFYVDEDLSVKDASGSLIQTIYGGDGIDPTKEKIAKEK